MAQRGKQAAAATPAIPPNRVLGAKEKSLFHQLPRLYEDKNYRRALKTADTILKRHPDHGETLAMKGLILNCMDRKKEAYELVKKGLKHDISSPICWHVYGLLYRSDREYAEAIKCYQQALKRDPKNFQIIRDLSILQVQTRDLKGLLETRKQLLKEKSTHRPNWIAYIIALHLAGEIKDAIKFMEEYESTPETEEQKPFDIELSEQLLYKIELYEESGDIQKALDELEKNIGKILDKVAYREKKALYLHKLGRKDEAIEAYRQLVKSNPDNRKYVEGLQLASGLEVPENERTAEIIEKIANFFDDLEKEFPKSQAVQLIPQDRKSVV